MVKNSDRNLNRYTLHRPLCISLQGTQVVMKDSYAADADWHTMGAVSEVTGGNSRNV